MNIYIFGLFYDLSTIFVSFFFMILDELAFLTPPSPPGFSFSERIADGVRYNFFKHSFMGFLKKILFIYLTEITSSQERQTERVGEAGSLPSREPDVGLDLRNLRP